MFVVPNNKTIGTRWSILSLVVLCLASVVPAWSMYDTREQFLDESVTKFTSDVFKGQMNTVGKNDNIFMSPISVQMILALLAAGAEGKTKEQMRKALHIPQDEQSTTSNFNKLLEDIKQGNENPALQFLIANKLYLRKGFRLNPQFQTAVDGFDTPIENINFSQKKPATDAINNWVQKRTKGKIPSIITPEDITQATSMILVNALHFDAKWHKTFLPENTSIAEFHGLEGKKYEVPLMMQKIRTRYAHLPEHDLQVVEVPYHNFEYTLTIIMPGDFATNVYVNEQVDELINVVKNQVTNNADVTMFIPKIKIEDKTNYEDILRVKMPDAFSQKANFQKIGANPQQSININKIVSKALIELNEQGTIAAAASAIGAVTLSIPQYIPEVEIRVDKPFIFMISNKRNNAPYFIGRYMHP